MKRWLLCWWWGPWTIVSIAAAWIWCAIGWGHVVRHPMRPRDLMAVWAIGPVDNWLSRRGWKGFTFGARAWFWFTPPNEDLIEHEADHVRWWEKWGWIAPFVAAGQYLRHGYKRAPLEVQARRASEKP